MAVLQLPSNRAQGPDVYPRLGNSSPLQSYRPSVSDWIRHKAISLEMLKRCVTESGVGHIRPLSVKAATYESEHLKINL